MTGPSPKARRPRSIACRPAVLYRLYGEGHSLVYVGCTVVPEARVRCSIRAVETASGGQPIVAVKFEHYATHEEALTMEARAIRRERPLSNRHPGRTILPDGVMPEPVRVKWFVPSGSSLVPMDPAAGAQLELQAALVCLDDATRRYTLAVAACNDLLDVAS